MKNSLTRNIWVIALGISTLLSLETMSAQIVETLNGSVAQATGDFRVIGQERKLALEAGAYFIRKKLENSQQADLVFICTHNSRRSHLSQLWAQTAAVYYGLTNVTTFSGGTEATACNIRTVRAFRRAGFPVAQMTQETNPVYLAQISDELPAVKLFSKKFTDSYNPQKDFAAIFSCDSAEESCPVVQGAALRLPILYFDPKVSDNTAAESATYDERSRQIAREMFYMMSKVKPVKQTTQLRQPTNQS